MYTLHDDIKKYQATINLEKILTRKSLTILRTIFFILFVTGTSLSAAYNFGIEIIPSQISLGLSIIFGALWINQLMIYAFHNSSFFYGLNSIIGNDTRSITGASYLVAQIVGLDNSDITKSFLKHKIGQEIIIRSGITIEATNNYLETTRAKISTTDVPLPRNRPFYLIPLVQYILKHDASFSEFITSQGQTPESFSGALKWVSDTYSKELHRERWWSRDNLSKKEGIGREWSYGTSYTLEKYARNINAVAVYNNLTGGDAAYMTEKADEVEASLAKEKSANVLIVGEAGVGKIDILLEVDKRIRHGKSIHSLADFHLLLLDTTRIFATHENRQDLEITLINLFTEAIKAGNIIIVIENLSTFIKEAESIGVFLPELLDPYLATPNLHIVATENPGSYHSYLEPLGAFTRRFTEILIDKPDPNSSTRILESIARNTEGQYKIIFTHTALVAITTAAERYLVEGVMPDKAIELMLDIAATANQMNTTLVTADFVNNRVSEKTGIPVGPIKDEERNLLLNLEEKLHERVIGQDEAITAIARTMRRARAGIQAEDKPIGSFLFLGPTGVGKTETAKALAFTFFGSEEKMSRLDMSEFSDEDALNKLIGNTNNSGILADLLREHPYCVLLLDEFEKSNRLVHDLFLQILDEGKFTDGRGDVVNARNTIIIATSNAGSKLIINTVTQRQSLATLQNEIINHIIKEGIYRPELLNRFDSTIIFEPLSEEELGEIAGLLLKNLQQRIREQGYSLNINHDLMTFLVKKGYNPEFGARPMQRVIQDFVEEKVAQKIISGKVERGGQIILTKEEFIKKETVA